MNSFEFILDALAISINHNVLFNFEIFCLNSSYFQFESKVALLSYWFLETVLTFRFSDLAFDWGSGVIIAGTADNVSARFKTTLTPYVSGLYTLAL